MMTAKDLVRMINANKAGAAPMEVKLSEEFAEVRAELHGVNLKSLTGDKLIIKKGWLGKSQLSHCRVGNMSLNGFEMRGAGAAECEVPVFKSGADLLVIDCNIRDCRLGRLVSKYALVTDSSFSGLHIDEVALERGQFKRCIFERCVFRGGRLSMCNFIRCTFTDVDMRGVKFDDSVFQDGQHPKLPDHPDNFPCLISTIAVVEDKIKPLLSAASGDRFAQMVRVSRNDHAVAIFDKSFFHEYSPSETKSILECLFEHRLRQE